MTTLRELVLFVHIILASLWVGGMLFLVFVVSPYIRKLPIRDQAFQEVGKRFSFYGTFGALFLLFVTGLGNIHYILGFENILDFSNPYTKTLWEKIGLFVFVVIVSLVHDLYFGKKAIESKFHRFMARVLGFINLVLSLLIVFLAAKLRFGG
ncbi:DUF4149 domain-containing protein [Thermocrinis minervae]|uniref:Copper resistance protein D n=1 Tax=Thermocrinis minervae TaxID=381751 RepID=A0A1M6QYE6_9AQUI|nr:DUF4149 domain-containing protein [Thermocrinis minervae]SHK25262.1 Copper resistance protein D [Thermocrinis minervae]